MKNLKGQAAMEFLMTYGWAILVVLVAIGALAYFGVLNPETLLPEKCLIQSGSGLFCEKNLVNADATADSVTLRLKNSLPDDVNVTSLTITTATAGICGAATIFEGAASTLAADNTKDFVITCTGLTAGKLKGDLTIDFLQDSFGKSTTGDLITTAA